MIGAIIGDIAGSRFEWNNYKSKKIKLFHKRCRPTDDSIMTLAVAKAILEAEEDFSDLSAVSVSCMQQLGRIYRDAGYGGNFYRWIFANDPQPYNSFGNGSAMRVSPCGYASRSLREAEMLSEKVTKVTHNHPEGMKGAEAAAAAIFLARDGKSKEEIRKYILEKYYQIDFTIDQIRPKYTFDVSCQGSVPVALEAFFESTGFEDAVKTAISVGGDSDTIAAITGSIAEAYYGVPENMIRAAIEYLDSTQMEILYYFEERYPSKAISEDGETAGSVFDVLNDAVDKVIPAGVVSEMRKELPDGTIIMDVPNYSLLPDFSSFDKKN